MRAAWALPITLVLTLVTVPLAASAVTGWSAVHPLAGTTSQTDSPALVGARDGSAVAAAVLDRSGVPTVTITRSADGGATWQSVPATLSTGAAASPALAVLNDGSIVAAWAEGPAPERVRISQSRDNGLSWSTPNTVSTASGSDAASTPKLAALGATGVALAWLQYDSGGYRAFVRTSPDLAVWSFGTPLSPVGEDAEQVTVTTNAAGATAVSWVSTNGQTPGFQAQYAFSGAWGSPISVPGGRLNTNSLPSIATDANDQFVVAAATLISGSMTIQALTYDSNGTLLFAPTPIVSSGFNYYPAIARTASGNLVVAWHQNYIGYSNLIVSTLGGSGWSGSTSLSSNTPLDQTEVGPPVVHAGADGSVAVSWTNIFSSGMGSQAQASISSDNGQSWGSMANVSSFTTSTPIVNSAPLSATGFVFSWADHNNSAQSNTQYLRVFGWSAQAGTPTTDPALAATGSDSTAAVLIALACGVVGLFLSLRRRRPVT